MSNLATIVRSHGAAYQARFGERMPPSHQRALRDIGRCRTAALGGQVYKCPECDETRYRYHACRNRHCPQCQQRRGETWLLKQRALLLPVPYFLVTFTLPEELRTLARSHQRAIYHLLFQASAKATQKLARDPRLVGGQIGMVGVLHTWTRNLAYHPHVHYLIPAGGWDAESGRWLPLTPDFFLPTRPLAQLFRGKFKAGLQRLGLIDRTPTTVWQKRWVVHVQPVGAGYTALRYLAPYIFRVAISNNRILRLVEGEVTFRYKASGSGLVKRTTLLVDRFLHRFLQHVLPRGFVKVRYFGFLAPGQRATLAHIRLFLGLEQPPTQPPALNLPLPTPDLNTCRLCGTTLIFIERLFPRPRDPPECPRLN